MLYLTILLFAVTANSDALIIGFYYSNKGVRIGHISNIFISLVCFVGTFVSILLGRGVGAMFDPLWGELPGSLLFMALGVWMLHGALSPRAQIGQTYTENPEIVDKDASKVIELRESMLIGLILCLNNIGLGIAAGIAGTHLLMAPLTCAVVSFLFIHIGDLIGGRIDNPLFAKVLGIVSAGIVLLLGLRGLVPLLLSVLR